MKSTIFLIALCWITMCDSITPRETEYFGSTGMPESNTGTVGYVTVSSNGNRWRFESNGVPDHDTGNYPGINPNRIVARSNVYNLPKEPTITSSPSCLPSGPIAMAVNGVIIFNPWDADGDNAVEGDGAEIFDQCDGHPNNQGIYHYHKMPSSCLFDIVEGEPSPLIGIAFDGFAIYGPNDENGKRLTSDDLDQCHGRINSDGVYQYHTTFDFPYILGCYKGTPVTRGGGNCFFASDADAEGNINSPDGNGDTPPGGGTSLPGQGRPPQPRRAGSRGVRFDGVPDGRKVGQFDHRTDGKDQTEQGDMVPKGEGDSTMTEVGRGPPRPKGHSRRHGRRRHRRSPEMDKEKNRKERFTYVTV